MNFGFMPSDKPTPSYQGFLGTAQSPSGTPYSGGYLFNSAVSPNLTKPEPPRQINLEGLMPSLMQMLGGGQQKPPEAPTAIQPPIDIPNSKPKTNQVQGVK